jgi:hypothetical protein
MDPSVYPLERYFREHPDVTKTALAGKVGTSPAKICDLIAGRLRRPSPELADRFEIATNKEVTARELLFFRPPPVRRKARVQRGPNKAA